MRISLELIVIAIVILITALVVITMFGIGIQRATTLSQAYNICVQQAGALCMTIGTGELPASWQRMSIDTPNGKTTCGEVASGCACSNGKLTGCPSPPQ